MKLIIGLGNVGAKYVDNRHNVGFKVIDLLAQNYEIKLTTKKFNGIFYKGEQFILAKPHTYMNLSGDFVQAIAHFYQIKTADILIIYDDMDLPIGATRFRSHGSSGGQNGMKDIILRMGTDAIPRLRIGIGRPGSYATNYVLSNFTKSQWANIVAQKNNIIQIIENFINDAI